MKLVKFKKYKDYIKVQRKANEKKKDLIWAGDEEMETISAYIKDHIPNLSFGICHGVRTGWEVERLRDLLQIHVIGTEIGIVEKDYIIQWDFHEIKPEWLGNTDFIYSNSFDHSYNPKRCLRQWMRCLNRNGLCFLEWSLGHEIKIDPCDCFGASLDEYKVMISKNYDISDEVNITCAGHSWKDKTKNHRVILVIKNRMQIGG